MKLILKDGSDVEIVQYTSNSFVVACADKEEFDLIWDRMTTENLSRVDVKDGDATVVSLENIMFDGVQAIYNTDRTITGYIYFHGQEYVTPALSEEDMEYAEVGRILLGEEVSR